MTPGPLLPSPQSMTRRKPAKKTPKKSGRKSAKTATVTANTPALIPQANGRGALLTGGVPGNRGGPGRPPDAIREHLRGSFDERVGVIEDIADGTPVTNADVPLINILPHVICPKCGEVKMEAKDPATLFMVSVRGKVSASPSERIKALDLAAKYGMGTKDEITIVSTDVRGRIDRQVSLIASRPTWTREELLTQLSEVWS